LEFLDLLDGGTDQILEFRLEGSELVLDALDSRLKGVLGRLGSVGAAADDGRVVGNTTTVPGKDLYKSARQAM